MRRARARWARAGLALAIGVALSCLGTGEAGAASATSHASTGASATGAGVVTGLWQPRGLPAAHTSATRTSATSTSSTFDAGTVALPAGVGSWGFEQPADATTADGVLLAESCTASAVCEAVGEYENSVGTTVTLAEARASVHGAWHVQRTPDPNGAIAAELTGVSCISALSCVAAGYEVAGSGDVFPVVERWNGTAWKQQSVPSAAGSSAAGFFAVSCSRGGQCTAVGEYDTSTGSAVPLVERWSGAAGWTIESAADPAGALDAGLFGVSCPSAGECVADGSSENASGIELPLAEAGSGGTWSVSVVPSPSGAETSALPSVSCASRVSCVAAGYSVSADDGTDSLLADAWNGSSWTALNPVEPTGTVNAQLLSVSCASVDACAVAGDYAGTSGSGAPLAERWNGKSWTVQPTSTPTENSGSGGGSGSASSSGFAAVSCGSGAASSCSAVGSAVTAVPSAVTLAEVWSGARWRIESTPDLLGAVATNTSGVSCAAPDFCAAVGYSAPGGGASVPFTEMWNGLTWSRRAAPYPQGAEYAELHAVSCAARDACLAVGTYGNTAGTSLPISEYWNGASWHVLPTPAPSGATDSELLGVSCFSAADCDAVGRTTDSAGNQNALAEHWNGLGWKTSAVPVATGGSSAELDGVSCAAANACIAVGSYVTDAQSRSTLAETWDGTRWRAQNAPNPGAGQGPALASVSCVSATACTAVGSYYAAGGGASLAEAWNGKAWSIQNSANPPDVAELALNGVSCTSPDACTAVGYDEADDFVPTTAFAEAWNGRTWALQSTPIPAGGNSSLLNAVSCVRASCTAAGYYFGYSGTQLALIEGRD